MFDNKIIIFGSDHHNTLGIIRSLGEKGIKPYAIIFSNSNNSFVLKSKYIKRGWLRKSPIECLDCFTFFKGDKSKAIIICSCDSAVAILDKYYYNFKDNFYLPLCKEHGRVVELMNKDKITELAVQYNISVPKSWKIINKKIQQDIDFPCITKSLTSLHGDKSDIVICNSRKELENVIISEKHCKDFLVQQYIKKDKEISILGAVLFDRKTVVFSGCIDKLREGGIGSSSFAVMIDNGFIGEEKEKLERLLLFTGYTGLFSAEYLYKEGKFYFLEVNFRNDGNGYVPTCAGLNLPYIWCESCVNGKFLNIKEDILKYPCYFMVEISDFINAINGKITLKRWWIDRCKTDCFLLYNKEDKSPFYRELRSMITYQFSKLKKKLHKWNH